MNYNKAYIILSHLIDNVPSSNSGFLPIYEIIGQ